MPQFINIPKSQSLKTTQFYVLLTLHPHHGMTGTMAHGGHSGNQDGGAAASVKAAGCSAKKRAQMLFQAPAKASPTDSIPSLEAGNTILSRAWRAEGREYLMNSSNDNNLGGRKFVLCRGHIRPGEKGRGQEKWEPRRKGLRGPKGLSVSQTILLTLPCSPELHISACHLSSWLLKS